MARIVIADAGPLIAFANVDALSVLRALFYELYVPEAVKDECLSKPGIDTNRIEVAIDEAGWLSHLELVLGHYLPVWDLAKAIRYALPEKTRRSHFLLSMTGWLVDMP